MATRNEIWQRVIDRSESEPCDGICADGSYSANLHERQRMFRKGVRVGGLAAMNVAAPKTDRGNHADVEKYDGIN